MSSENSSRQDLLAEITSLRDRLAEAEETLRAISSGEVDAFIVSGPEGERVFTLEGADHSYRIMVEAMQEGAVNLAADGTILYANQRMATMLQVPLESLIGRRFEDCVVPADRTYFGSLLENMGQQRVGGEFALLTGTGQFLPVLVTCGANSHPGGEAISVVLTDLTERKQIENELNETREILQAAMDQSPAGIAIAEAPDGRLRYVNDAGLLIRGGDRESVVNGIGIDQYVASWQLLDLDGRPLNADEVPLARAIMFGEQASREFLIRRNEGDDRTVLANAAPIMDGSGEVASAVVVFTDISEMRKVEVDRQNLEKKMFEAQKLESLGVLAGGIAHDFNNILMTILGNTDLALMRIRPESPALINLKMIEEAATRAADLAAQMLAYSGKGRFIIEALDINRLLEEMAHMIEVSISKKAVLRLKLTPNLPSVEADATQLRQVILNLIINASDAVSEKSGIIAISTGGMECDTSYLQNGWLKDNLPTGFYLFLEISDTGCGMSQETLANIFDPFFTTKATGRGLGLAAVLGIIKGHKGAVRVYSEPGKGTSFKILLPASDRRIESSSDEACPENWRGHGTVLLTDDEETVLEVGALMLKELGFTPITAKDGREALALFKETPDITAVILDLTMPHLNGEQCFRELRKIQPDVKVIIASGYNEQEVTEKFIGRELSGFLQKPFRFSSLRKVLRALIDSSGG